MFLVKGNSHYCKNALENTLAIYTNIIVFFNHVKDSLTLTPTVFVLDMIFNYNYTKLDLLGKMLKIFLCNFEEFILEETHL